MTSGVKITSDEITPNLRELNPRLYSAIYTTMQFFADRAESAAKSNARWQDQTGNARQGLTSKAFAAPDQFTLVLFHTMPYGVWLEVRWSGRYAIILPTIEQTGPELMAAIRGIMGRL